MRKALAQFEDKLVVVSGKLTEYRKQPNGLCRVCLVGVEVGEFTDERPLSEQPLYRIDHLWISDTPQPKHSINMLNKYCVVGRPYWYTRSDGSVDLSIKSVEAINLGKLFLKIKSCKTYADRVATAFEINNELKQTTKLYWSWLNDPKHLLKLLEDFCKKAERNLEKELSARAGSQHNGPCTRATAVTGLKRASKQRKPALGF